jgi:hypothetical protein
MENNFDDKLAQKIRESLENYPVAYEQQAWEQFSRNHLHKPSVRKIALWQRPALRIAATLLIAVAGLCAIYYWRSQQPAASADVIAAQATPQEGLSSGADNRAHFATIPNDSAQLDVAIAQKTVPPIKDTPPIDKQSNKKSFAPTPVESVQGRTKLNSNPQSLLPSEEQLAASAVVKTAEPVTLTQVDRLPLALSDSFAWQFPVIAAAQLPVYDWATTQSGTVIKIQPSIQALSGIAGGAGVENAAVFYGAGAGVDLFLHKKLALTTGIQLIQTNYETPARSFRVFNNLKMDSVSAAIGIYRFVPVFADETQYARVRLNLIQIPVTIKYLIGKKFFLNIGGISYVATNKTQVAQVAQHSFLGRVQTPTQAIENSIQPFRTIYLGSGMRVPLKKATLQVEPHLSLPLGDILQDVHNTSLQWIGLNVGIYYRQ